MITNINGDGAYVSEVFQVRTSDSQPPVQVFCHWSTIKSYTEQDVAQHFHSLDLVLNIIPNSARQQDADQNLYIADATGTALETLVRHVRALDNKTQAAVKVILTPQPGYVCRSDILDLRMRHSEFVDAVISFATWDKHLPSIPTNHEGGLLTLLRSSPGALIAKSTQSSYHETLKVLQKDAELRLSFDWILSTKPVARTVAVVAGRPMREPKRGIYWSQSFFEAAQALGISLIVLDEPGHWLQGDQYEYLRKEFVPVDLSNIRELPSKLAAALTGKSIDGIVTFTDDYVVATAEAAEILGLPAEPAHAMRQAHHKQEMRKLINKSNVQVMFLDSVKELDVPAVAEQVRNLKYPLIVKPCRSVYSQGVKKVTDNASLRQALYQLEQDDLTDHGILLETYVNGPEVDANFVLWDGEVLFLEVNDNFPCQGDTNSATPSDNFAETVAISNSGLPPQELEIIRSSLHRNLLQLGFRSGVFHVEARMLNSSMEYQDVQSDGILDLAPITAGANEVGASSYQPDTFLIEVNVRPPGAGGTWTTMYTYGVHMGGLQLLRVLNDSERFKVLSQPFAFPSSHPGDGGGAQYWTAHSMIPVHRDNISVPEDFFERVYQVLPEIVPYVTRAELYAQPGTVVSPSGGVGWIGYLLLISRISKRHVLEMYHQVAAAAKKILDSVSEYKQ